MENLYVILFCLTLWWVVVALLAIKHELSKEMRDLRHNFKKEPPSGPRERYGLQGPTWEDCMAHPSLFIIIAVFQLLAAILFVWVWPKLLIHWLLYGRK